MTARRKKKIATGHSGVKEKPEKIMPSMILPYEELWRPLYPFRSHYMRIGGLAYHYIDEGPVNGGDSTQYEEPINIDRAAAGGSETADHDFPVNKPDADKIKEVVEGKPAKKNKLNQEEGTPLTGQEPVLLMVHGNPTWSFYWRKLIQEFRSQYRVIAVDHIGCGLSEKPSETQYPFTLEARIQNLSHLIRKLNLNRIVLIAHDWGGAVGMGAAIQCPRRFSRFVLMNTGAFRSSLCPLRIRLCRTPLLGRLMLQGLNAFSLAALKMATTQPGGLVHDVAAGMIAPYDSWEHRTAVYQFVQDIPLSEHHRSWKKLGEVQEGLSLFREHPVSLIWGMKDWCFSPEFLKRFLQFFPEAEVHRLEKAGHYLVEDAAPEVIDIIREFVKKPFSD